MYINLSEDMYTPGSNFIFGETRRKILSDGTIPADYYMSTDIPYVKGSIISLNRILKWYGERWALPTFGIMMHELGHVFGIPPSTSPYFIRENDRRSKSWLDYGHCENRNCIMEQVNSPGRLDLLEKAEYVQRHNQNWFCWYDLKTLEENLRRLYA